MSTQTGLILRIFCVGLAVTGVGVIAHRMAMMTAAINHLATAMADTPATRSNAARSPLPAEAERLRMLSDRITVISQNLANAQTVAFKRRRVEVNNGPESRTTDYPLDMVQGSLQNTGQVLDLAIQGDGFLHLRLSPQTGDGTGYTRNGSLSRDANGNLVVGIGEGYELIPPINIPQGAMNLAIATDGTVSYLPAGSTTRVMAGQIQLCRFMNPQSLALQSAGIYTETQASGYAVTNAPGEHGTGVVQSGFLEDSNVDPIKESLFLAQAEQSMQTSGDALQTAIRARQSLAQLDRR